MHSSRTAFLASFLCLALSPTLRAQDPGAGQDPAATPPAATQEVDAPRVLIVGFASKPQHEVYRDALVQRVRELALAQGLSVVDPEQAQLLEARRRARAGETAELPPEWLQQTGADLVLRLELIVEEESSKQGREYVRDRVRLAAFATDDAEIFFERSAVGEARSLRGGADAHAQAISSACGADGALVTACIAALREREATETARGPRYRLCVHTGGVGAGEPVLRGEDLVAIAGAAEVDQESADSKSTTYKLRYRGKRYELEAALFRLVGQRSEALRESLKCDLGAELSASRRRLDLFLARRDASISSVTEELRSAMERLARSMYEREPSWYDDTRIRYEPAMIPSGATRWNELVRFTTAFWREVDAQRRLHPDVDPFVLEGAVNVEGQSFTSLRDARGHAEELAKQYYESPAGTTAIQLASYAETAFEKVSQRKISAVVDEPIQASILYTIKSETALFREEDAVEESSVEFFQRRGANRLAAVRLVKPFDAYNLQITVVDLQNGIKSTHSTDIPMRFTEKLDTKING